MIRRYLAYGLAIESDADLGRHLYETDAAGPVIRLLETGEAPASEEIAGSAMPLRSHGRQLYVTARAETTGGGQAAERIFSVDGVVSYRWLPGSRTIRYCLGPEANKRLLSFWTVNMALPVFLALERQYDFIHAGAVEIDRHAILFAAPSFGGKSTLTAHFIGRGHALVSDDKVPVWKQAGRYVTVASHDNYRPYRSTEDLGYRAEQFCRERLPLLCVYVLQRVEPLAAVQVGSISGFRRFGDLLFNYMFNFVDLRPRRLGFLSDLVNTVNVNTLQVPHDLARLDEVHNAVCTHARSLMGRSGSATA